MHSKNATTTSSGVRSSAERASRAGTNLPSGRRDIQGRIGPVKPWYVPKSIARASWVDEVLISGNATQRLLVVVEDDAEIGLPCLHGSWPCKRSKRTLVVMTVDIKSHWLPNSNRGQGRNSLLTLISIETFSASITTAAIMLYVIGMTISNDIRYMLSETFGQAKKSRGHTPFATAPVVVSMSRWVVPVGSGQWPPMVWYYVHW